MILPQSNTRLVPWAEEIIYRCRVSVGNRAMQARALKTWRFTGSPDGNPAILNRLNHHIDRMASFLFSPSDLRFAIDFTHTYPKAILDKAEVAARVLTRQFEQRDIDIQFAEAVDLALTYGACIPKLIGSHGGLTCRLLLPWQIGVYREDQNDFHNQEAVCETNYITPFDLWRRISHLPDAQSLFKRAMGYAKKKGGGSQGDGDSYFHQVLLAATPPVVQTEAPFSQQPGGLVSVTADAAGGMLSPEVAQELIEIHELWVLDDVREDFTTIQMVEPDIMIAPSTRRTNMFVPEHLPYTLVQPNRIAGNFWGRSELSDLLKLQHLLRDRLEDIKKMMALQYDRRLAFIGNSGMGDEEYDQFMQAGYVAMETGSKVEDITPELPKESFQEIQEILDFMDEVSGFRNVLSGQGEPGVRAGNHAQMLMRTASPRLRDRALLVERQAADLGEKAFEFLAHKEAKAYWTADGNEFLLEQLPEDYRIMVDSHSSSPIYEEDHQQVAAFLMKAGAIDGESLIELLPVPRRDLLKQRYRDMQKSKEQHQQQLLKQHPELAAEILTGKKGHHASK